MGTSRRFRIGEGVSLLEGCVSSSLTFSLVWLELSDSAEVELWLGLDWFALDWLLLAVFERAWLVLEALEEESELLDWGDSEAFCREQASKQQHKPSKASTFRFFIPTSPFIYMITLSLPKIKLAEEKLNSSNFCFLYHYSKAPIRTKNEAWTLLSQPHLVYLVWIYLSSKSMIISSEGAFSPSSTTISEISSSRISSSFSNFSLISWNLSCE